MNEILEYLKSADHLRGYLAGFKVPVDQWGESGKKSIAELYKELLDGDCYLTVEKGVIRCTRPLFIDVRYSNQETMYQCFESLNKKGKVRNLPGTFAEKRLVGEDIEQSIQRTYQEEINKSLPKSGISLIGHELVFGKEWVEKTEAHSYPGLTNMSSNTLFNLIPKSNQGIPTDFTLVESNGTTNFSWREI